MIQRHIFWGLPEKTPSLIMRKGPARPGAVTAFVLSEGTQRTAVERSQKKGIEDFITLPLHFSPESMKCLPRPLFLRTLECSENKKTIKD